MRRSVLKPRELGVVGLVDLGKRIRASYGNDTSAEFLRQCISLDIQRGNASRVLGTRSLAGSLDDMFIVLKPTEFRDYCFYLLGDDFFLLLEKLFVYEDAYNFFE